MPSARLPEAVIRRIPWRLRLPIFLGVFKTRTANLKECRMTLTEKQKAEYLELLKREALRSKAPWKLKRKS